MKILHLATSTSGGTGIAARRLNSALVESDLDSILLTGSKSGSDIYFNEELIEKKFLDLVKSKFNTVFQQTFVQRDEFLTTLYSVRKITIKQILDHKPDLVHIHSSYNFIHNIDLLELRSKVPVVITLHDERYLTGACHCTLGCERFRDRCIKCPQVKRPFRYTVEKNKSQRSLFGGVSEVLHVICPSEWIQSQVTKLNNSSDIKTYVVRNPISKKLAADDFKKPTTISNEKYKITFVAQNLFNRYKGLDTLLRCISDYSLEFKSQNISFVFVGAGPRIDIGELKAQQIDLLKEDQIQKVLNGSDLLIVPSLSDNSPNVIFEALACGVPFVCSDRAGLLELGFEFGMNVFKYGESRSIFEAIIRQKNSAVNPQELREKALSIVSPQIVAKTMIGIYNEILASS